MPAGDREGSGVGPAMPAGAPAQSVLTGLNLFTGNTGRVGNNHQHCSLMLQVHGSADIR